MSLPKVKPRAGAPKLKKKAAAVPKAAYRLLADQYRARQGNLTQEADPELVNGTAATEYGERQIHQTVQGTVHTFSSAAQAPFRKAGRSIRRRLHNPIHKGTSRQIDGRFLLSPSQRIATNFTVYTKLYRSVDFSCLFFYYKLVVNKKNRRKGFAWAGNGHIPFLSRQRAFFSLRQIPMEQEERKRKVVGK